MSLARARLIFFIARNLLLGLMWIEEKMNWNTVAADLAAPPVQTHGPVTLSRANSSPVRSGQDDSDFMHARYHF